MNYPIRRNSFEKHGWIVAFSAFLLWLMGTILVPEGKLDGESWEARFITYFLLSMGVVSLTHFLSARNEEPKLTIEGNRLYLGKNYSYPIEALEVIEIRSKDQSALKMRILASQMKTIRTGYVENGIELIGELHRFNPGIEVRNVQTDA
ncbi:MAG: hypothetical protein AAF918_00020 [Pseudomonadota bacterium]